jgi:hypothetical protein
VVARFLRGASGADRDARLKQFLQLLYVAVTRARRHLAVFDGVEAHPFWTAHRFHGRLESEGVETLGRLFRDSASAAEWAREGRHYFERLRYRQAAECYRRAGMAEKETTALAMHAETLERWQDALGYWQSIGVEGRQAELLEKLGRFQEARDVHARLGREKEAARLDLILLEKAGRWAEAAERWEKAGSPADAVRCYQRAGNHARALKLDATAAEKHKDWKRAADYWSSLKSYEAAARCYREAGDKKSAALAMAHQYEGAKDWNKAAAAYQRAGDRAKARELMALALESAGETAMAASIYERLGQHDRAFQLYRKAGDQSALDRFAVERADLRQPQLQAVEKLFERANYSLAIKLIEKRQAVIRMRLDRTDWYVSDSADRQLMKERDALAKLQIECRAYLAEHAKSWSKAAALWRRLRQFERADLAQEKHIEAIADPVERGVAWLQAGALERATNLFQSAGAADWLIRARAVGCQREKQWEQAAELWQSVGDTINHAAAMARVAYEKQDWPSAARWHQLAGQKNLAAEAARRARMEHAESDRKRRTETPLF